jgi:hypothetical protein
MIGHTRLLQLPPFFMKLGRLWRGCDTSCVVQSCYSLCNNMCRLQVVTFAGELLDKAVDLLKEGLNTCEVADGYQIAADKVCIIGLLHPQARPCTVHGRHRFLQIHRVSKHPVNKKASSYQCRKEAMTGKDATVSVLMNLHGGAPLGCRLGHHKGRTALVVTCTCLVWTSLLQACVD